MSSTAPAARCRPGAVPCCPHAARPRPTHPQRQVGVVRPKVTRQEVRRGRRLPAQQLPARHMCRAACPTGGSTRWFWPSVITGVFHFASPSRITCSSAAPPPPAQAAHPHGYTACPPVTPCPRAHCEVAEQRRQHGVPRAAVGQKVQQQRQVQVLGLEAWGQGTGASGLGGMSGRSGTRSCCGGVKGRAAPALMCSPFLAEQRKGKGINQFPV